MDPTEFTQLPQPFVQFIYARTSCSGGAQPVAGIAWIITMVVESILFAMVLVKSRKKDRQEPLSFSTRFDLMGVLARDSKIYYVM